MSHGSWDLFQPRTKPRLRQWKCQILTTGLPGNSHKDFQVIFTSTFFERVLEMAALSALDITLGPTSHPGRYLVPGLCSCVQTHFQGSSSGLQVYDSDSFKPLPAHPKWESSLLPLPETTLPPTCSSTLTTSHPQPFLQPLVFLCPQDQRGRVGEKRERVQSY